MKAVVTLFYCTVGACSWMFIKAIGTVSIPITCPTFRNTLLVSITTEEHVLFTMEFTLVDLAHFWLLVGTVCAITRSVTKPVLGNTKGRCCALKFGSIVARFE
jgi:hypothetical protein